LDASAERRALYKGRTVLELGAGLGLVGMYMSKTGAARTLLTDLHEQLPLLKVNLEANFKKQCPNQNTSAPSTTPWIAGSDPNGPIINIRELDWGEEGVRKSQALDEKEGSNGPTWDLIVASDVVYDECCVECLALAVTALLRGSPTRSAQALFALPDRCEFDPEGEVPDYQRVFDIIHENG
jgi:predicted nicotinamide N-methyase